MSQKYQIVVFLNLSKPTKEIKLFLKEAIFLDLENKKLLHHMPFEIGKDDLNLDQVTEYIFEKKLLEKTLSFNVSSKELFLDMLRNKDNTFKNKGLYNDFLVKPFAIVVDDVELFFQKIDKDFYDSRNLYRIGYHPPWSKKIEKEKTRKERRREKEWN